MYARHPQQQLVCACVHDRSSHTFNNHCHRSLSVAGRQAGWGRRAQSTDGTGRDGTGRDGVTACRFNQRTFLCILRARVASCCKAAALACSAAASPLPPPVPQGTPSQQLHAARTGSGCCGPSSGSNRRASVALLLACDRVEVVGGSRYGRVGWN